MSNIKHTPGPWKYAPEFSAIVIVRDHKLKAIADFGKVDLPETEANARMIAAAPDMESAIQFVLNDLNSKLDYEARLILESAIAKATGE